MDANKTTGGSEPLVAGYDVALRVAALESLLTEKGLVTAEAIDTVTDLYEHDIGPLRGATVVARAWLDADFAERLRQDAGAACEELGITGYGAGTVAAVFNSESVHNVIVCTLCSCYPWGVLGLPPKWYKEPAYRAKIVLEPRRTLREDFGFEIPDDVEIRVWDSLAEMRYFVVPERPASAEGLSEIELRDLVTRDALLGVRPVVTS